MGGAAGGSLAVCNCLPAVVLHVAASWTDRASEPQGVSRSFVASCDVQLLTVLLGMGFAVDPTQVTVDFSRITCLVVELGGATHANAG
jgi:hypothetical protein